MLERVISCGEWAWKTEREYARNDFWRKKPYGSHHNPMAIGVFVDQGALLIKFPEELHNSPLCSIDFSQPPLSVSNDSSYLNLFRCRRYMSYTF